MKVHIGDLLRTNGAALDFAFREILPGCGSKINGFIFDSPVEFKGRIENIKGALRIEGSLSAGYRNICGRCLKDLEGTLELDVHESMVNEETNTEPDSYTYKDWIADVGIIARDNIVLNTPMRIICSDDCKGLCPICGANLNLTQCGCDIEDYDLRLGELKDLFKDKE